MIETTRTAMNVAKYVSDVRSRFRRTVLNIMTTNFGVASAMAPTLPDSPSPPVTSTAQPATRATSSDRPSTAKKGRRISRSASANQSGDPSTAYAICHPVISAMTIGVSVAHEVRRHVRLAVECHNQFLLLLDQPPLLQMQFALSPLGGVRIVRHHDDRLVQVLAEHAEQVENFRR